MLMVFDGTFCRNKNMIFWWENHGTSGDFFSFFPPIHWNESNFWPGWIPNVHWGNIYIFTPESIPLSLVQLIYSSCVSRRQKNRNVDRTTWFFSSSYHVLVCLKLVYTCRSWPVSSRNYWLTLFLDNPGPHSRLSTTSLSHTGNPTCRFCGLGKQMQPEDPTMALL